MSSGGHTAPYGLRQRQNQLPSESQVSVWSLSSLFCLHLVKDVGIHCGNLQYPEEHLAPPLDGLVQEAIVTHHLVKFVDSKHVLVIVDNHDRLLLQCSSSAML